jgi:hypothetical protein
MKIWQVTILVILFLVAVLILLVAGILLFKPVPVPGSLPTYTSRPMATPSVDAGNQWDACQICKEFVKRELLSPTSARFPSCYDVDIRQTDVALDEWYVEGYVDAENAFGVVVRSYYSCGVRYFGNEEWGLVSLTIE